MLIISFNFEVRLFFLQRHKRKGLLDILNPPLRSSSLHAKEVSWVYQSGNKYKNFENQVMNSFMDVSIGKQKIKNMKNIVF